MLQKDKFHSVECYEGYCMSDGVIQRCRDVSLTTELRELSDISPQDLGLKTAYIYHALLCQYFVFPCQMMQ
jgi:hypothetical protein